MEKIGYDLTKCRELSFRKGRRTVLQPFVPKGEAPDYYDKTGERVGYTTNPKPSIKSTIEEEI